VTSRRRGGFSVIELLVTIVVFGLLASIAMPRMRAMALAEDLRAARGAVVSVYGRARVHAIETRKPATLWFNASSAWVTVPDGGGGLDTVGTRLNLTSAYGVTMTYTGNVTILPTGLVNAGVPITVTVTKQGKSDSLVISGYGRIQ
jgi:prepilin-type N-terminal cleavage/methylation domain-containing protein